MRADWWPRSIFFASEKEFTTTARVFPRRIWKTDVLYFRHHDSQTVAWSSPRARRWPVIGRAPGISGMPFM